MDQRDKDRMLWNLRSFPNELTDMLSGLDEEALRWRPIPNRWSLKETLCHLRDAERKVYLERYRCMLTEDAPFFPNVNQDRLAEEGDYINQNTGAVFDEFRLLREETIQTLENAPPETWSRSGTHETDGPLTIEQLVVRQIKSNDIYHLNQMKDIVRLKMPW